MNMYVFLFIACFACHANAQATENPLFAMMSEPIHEWFQQLQTFVEEGIDFMPLLKDIGMGLPADRLLAMAETYVKDFLFNKALPWMMNLLQEPAGQLRALVVTVRDYLAKLDVKSLSAQLPNFISTTVSYIDMGLKAFDQIRKGNIDAKAFDVPAATTVTTRAPSGAAGAATVATVTTRAPSGAATVATTTKPWYRIFR